MQEYTREQLLGWLSDAITKFPKMQKIATMSAALRSVGCTYDESSWDYRMKKDEEIRVKYMELKKLVKDRIIKHAMYEDPKTQQFAKFLLACNFGFIEESQERSLELQEKKLSIEQDSNDILRDHVINIGFKEPDSGTNVDPYLIEE